MRIAVNTLRETVGKRLVSLGAGPVSQLTKYAVTQLRRMYAPDAMN